MVEDEFMILWLKDLAAERGLQIFLCVCLCLFSICIHPNFTSLIKKMFLTKGYIENTKLQLRLIKYKIKLCKYTMNGRRKS